MTALAHQRMSSIERWTSHSFPLAAGTTARRNRLATIDTATGKVRPGYAAANLFVIGKFAETVDATGAEAVVNVDLGTEIEVEWWANSTFVPVGAANVGSLCYVEDDQTVSMLAEGASVAGRVWAVHAVNGVAVQRLRG